MKKLQIILAVLAVSVFSCGLTQATPLPPGSTLVVPLPYVQAVVGMPGPLGAPFVAELLGAPFASARLSGTVDSHVYVGDPANPFGLTGLDFVYQIHLSAASLDSLTRMTDISFAGLLADVAQAIDGLPSTPALTADRSASSGAVIGWNFAVGTFGPGTNSFFLMVRTNAITYGTGTANLIDGAVATADILAPTIPDGGSALALLGIGLTGIEFLRRKFRKA